MSGLFNWRWKKAGATVAIFGYILALSAEPVAAATRTWDGSANGNLSTAANWVGGVAPVNGDDLVFPASGVSRFAVTNNFLGGPRFRSITFQGTGFRLHGAFMVLSNGIGAHNQTGFNRVHCAIELAANQTFFINGDTGARLDITGDVMLGSRTLTVSAGAGSMHMSGVISGTGGLTKISTGNVRLDGPNANTYSGLTRVSGGTLDLNKGAESDPASDAVAVPGDIIVSATLRLLRNNQIATSSNVTITDGGLLDLFLNASTAIGTLTMTGGSVSNLSGGTLILNGNVTATGGASGPASISGNLSIGLGPRTFTVNDNAATDPDLDITAAISGTSGIIKAGAGTLAFSGSASNTFMGATRAFEGTLVLRRTSADRSIPGNLFIGDGLGGTNSDVVRIEAFPQINDQAVVVLASSGYLEVNGANLEAIGSLTGEGQMHFVPPSPSGFAWIRIGDNGASTIYSGQITGRGHLTKRGTGTLTLTANNTYSGSTLVNEGTLLVNGSQPQSFVSMAGSAILGGTGIVGTINPAATLRPGLSPGILQCSNLVFVDDIAPAGHFFVELNGSTPGNGYDQLIASGEVTLSNATLHVSLDTEPLDGQRFTIILNDGTDPVNGTFNGLAEGAALSVGGRLLQITYTGGDGNDVELTLAELEPTGVTRVWSGAGTNNFWSNPSNWVANAAPQPGDDLEFPFGALRTVHSNDFPITTWFNAIRFTGVNYFISGNAVLLNAGISNVPSSLFNTVLFPLVLLGPQSFYSSSNVGLSISGGINLNGQTLTLHSEGSLKVSEEISGSGALVKVGAGVAELTSTNTYSGFTTVTEGTLRISRNLALGSPGDGTIVQSGATLDLSGSLMDVAEPVTVSGTLATVDKTNTWSGLITLSGEATVSARFSNAWFYLTGPVTGGGDFHKTGSGTVELSGLEANSHTGTTFIDGRLRLNKPAGVPAIPGNLVIGTAASLQPNLVELGNPEQIVDHANLTFTQAGRFDLNNFSETVSNLNMAGGAIETGSGALRLLGNVTGSASSNSATIAGRLFLAGSVSNQFNIADGSAADDLLILADISDGPSNPSVPLRGGGRVVFGGANSYSGPTLLRGAQLIINGTLSSSDVVTSSGTLGGTGTVNHVTGSGSCNIAPGLSPGILRIRDATLNTGNTTIFELNGVNAGTDYDQLCIIGSNTFNLGRSSLRVMLGFTPALHDSFRIIDKTSAGSVAETFAGLPEGAIFTVGANVFRITYAGGDGNDVVLTRIPAPASNIESLLIEMDGAQLRVQGLPNLEYAIEAATNLNAPIMWLEIGKRTGQSGSGVFIFTDTNTSLYPMRFYRVVSP